MQDEATLPPESTGGETTSVRGRQTWLPLAVFAMGLAGFLDLLCTVEWWFPACSETADGPVGAVFGLPLPYLEASIGVSLGFRLDPVLYVAGQLLLATVIFTPLWGLRRLLRGRTPPAGRRGSKRMLVGLGLWAVSVARLAFFLLLGMWSVGPLRPSAADLLEFRPDRLVDRPHARCTRSLDAPTPRDPLGPR